jgi:PhnO protein
MQNRKFIIREAVQDDDDVMYEMICELENEVLNRASFQYVLNVNRTSGSVVYFIAEVGGNTVGMASCHIQCLLHHAAQVAEIQEMYVKPEFRSKQIGNALMDHIVAFSKSMGAIQLEVTSRATRERAHQFYERTGFEKSHVKLVRYFRDNA